MKNTIRLALALALGIMIGAAGTALAAGEVVRATFQKFAFVVNGESVEMDEDALVYQGSTYLPVRALLNALGYDVTYVAASKTIRADKPVENLLDELQKIGGGVQVDPVDEMTLDEIERQIEGVKGVIRAMEIALPWAEEIGPPGSVEKTLDQIAKQQARLAELEAKKAELEAQLQ